MPERVPALIFTVHGRQYGLLQEGGAALLPWLQRYTSPGPLPGVPSWMLGLLNVQGTVQPIVDLGAFLGYGATIPANDTRLIFIERDKVCIGLLVDNASGMRYLDNIEPTDGAEPLVSGQTTLNASTVHMLNGGALIDALTQTLDTPHAGRA